MEENCSADNKQLKWFLQCKQQEQKTEKHKGIHQHSPTPDQENPLKKIRYKKG